MKLKIRNSKKCRITISMNINKKYFYVERMPKSRGSVQSVYIKVATYLSCVTKPDMKFIVKKNEW